MQAKHALYCLIYVNLVIPHFVCLGRKSQINETFVEIVLLQNPQNN